MQEKWLNLVLKITNQIYQKKQAAIGSQGLKSIASIISLILSEIALALISLPLYLTTKTDKTSAFLSEKGGYGEIATDYKLRRVMTISGVGIVLAVWLVKLILLVGTPAVYGPLKLYSVSELKPVEINQQATFVENVDTQTAKIADFLPAPTIKSVERKSDSYIISGAGAPSMSVVLFLTTPETVTYFGEVDKNGNWQIEHLQKDFKLKEGIHSIFAFHYNKAENARSKSSDVQYFRVVTTLMERVSQNIDSIANWSIVILILLGIMLTALTV